MQSKNTTLTEARITPKKREDPQDLDSPRATQRHEANLEPRAKINSSATQGRIGIDVGIGIRNRFAFSFPLLYIPSCRSRGTPFSGLTHRHIEYCRA